ncbi:uncharacterized protein EV420DRAFT_1649464 [Desarmillaria tabescens]|uniref:Uncharacterized protein n=1 Tax=Armillaria tabescens TaxID=1929756 RepID=A0AA39JIG9_ARMTA|nr:uncharacterized protein EV420DRAFT_1649464 [Desarmillaria tabescens]KAK0443039.1 hypothetical protein EV420DRAFT_1649464 [Desarmillaria tabescens]
MDSNTAPRPIPTIHLPALQSSPPTQHLPGDLLGFPDPPAPLVFPVDPADISNTDSRKVTRLWPSCIPLFTFTEHSCLQERKDRIIQVLKLSKNKRLRNNLRTTSDRVLKYNQYTETFSEETGMLDRLLTSVFACTTFTKDVVYKMDENIYQRLHTRLTTRRAIASSSLNSFGYSDFKVPTWAINTAKGLTANDFEIYALQYRIRVEHFLHMLDFVHDWSKLRTRVYLDENLLETVQRSADRARLEKRDYYLPVVPPITYSNPIKSKTSCQASASDLSGEGVHYAATRDTERHPSNLQAAERRGRHENLHTADYRGQIPADLYKRNPSLDKALVGKSVYHGCSPSNPDSGQGGDNGDRLVSCRSSYNQRIPACYVHSERTSVRFDTTFKPMNVPPCSSNPDTRVSCENKFNNTPTLNHNTGIPILHSPTKNEVRTFRIASNTPCIPFSKKGLPRKVRRHIDKVERQRQRENRRRPNLPLEETRPLFCYTSFRKKTMTVEARVYYFHLDIPRVIMDSGLDMAFAFHKAFKMVFIWPKVRKKINLNRQVIERTRQTESRSHKQHLGRHGMEVETPIASAIDGEHRNEVYVLFDTSQFTKLQSHRRTQKAYCRSKHRSVPGDIRAKKYIVILAKPKPAAGRDNRFLSVSFASSTNAPTIPIMLEATATERDSKRLLTNCPQSVEFNATSLRAMPEKTECDQLHRSVQLNTSSNGVPFHIFIMRIGVSRISPFGNSQTGLLMCSTDVAPTVAQTEVHTSLSIAQHRRRIIHASGSDHEAISIPLEFPTNRKRHHQKRNQLTGPMRQLDDQIRDPGINIQGMVEINIILDNEAGYSYVWWKDSKPGTVSRVNEPILVLITQRKEGRGDQHHQYHSHFGNNSEPGTTKADSPCYHRTMEPSSMHASPKRPSGTSCDRKYFESSINVKPETCHWAQMFRRYLKHYPVQGEVRYLRYRARLSTRVHSLMRQCVLFLEQHASRETRWQQGEDLPCRLIYRLSVFHISNICCSLTAIGNWNTTSPVRIPGKGLYRICRGSRKMKRRPHITPKSWGIRTVRNPHRIAIRIKAQTFPNATSKEFNITTRHELIMAFLHCLPSFTFILADKELGEFLDCRDLRKFQKPQFPAIPTVLWDWDFTTGLGDRQQHVSRIRCSPRLEFLCPLIPESISFPRFSVYPHLSMIAEVAAIKQELRRLLTERPQSVALNTVSWKPNLTENTENKQLKHRVRLITSSNDVPGDNFIMHIAFSPIVPSGHKEASLLAHLTGLAPTAQLPEVDTEVIGRRRCLHTSGNEVNDTETSRQCIKVDTISSVNGTMVEWIRRQNDGAHHQYHSRFGNCSEEPALADSPLHRTKLSSIRVSSGLCLYLPIYMLVIAEQVCHLPNLRLIGSCNSKRPVGNAISEGD